MNDGRVCDEDKRTSDFEPKVLKPRHENHYHLLHCSNCRLNGDIVGDSAEHNDVDVVDSQGLEGIVDVSTHCRRGKTGEIRGTRQQVGI